MKIYSLIAMGISAVYGNSVIETMGRKVVNGNIVYDLVQPMSIYKSYLIDDLCRIINCILTHFLPVIIITVISFSISLREIQLIGLTRFIVLIILGYFIMFSFCFFVSLLSAWIVNVYNCRFMINQILRLATGSIIPIWMWPESMKKIIMSTPFPYIISAPTSFLIKNTYEYSFLKVLLNQLMWCFIIIILNYIVYKLFRKKINIQGG